MDESLAAIDLALLKRYDKPGPRYTSYPTAPLFSKDYDGKRFEVDVIINNDKSSAPISLYVHIPFCDTLCYFCGCTTIITKNRGQISRYLEVLKREIQNAVAYISKERRVTQIHWGGGTPSYLLPEEIRDMMHFMRDRFTYASDAEVSVEIDPRGLTFEQLQAFSEGGVNRISIGVQDFSERVQKAVNRIQPEEVTLQSIAWAKQLGISGINIDLIYGLPMQTVESFRKTLDKVVAISPNRISVFNFAYVPWMKPHQKLIHPEDLPGPDAKLELLRSTISTLTMGGYVYIGMDHFAKPDDELTIAQEQKTLHRNFQGYSTRAGTDLYGFGLSAISHIGSVYAQNAKTLPEYYAAADRGEFPVHLGYRMNRDDMIRKYVIMRLMCDLEVRKEDVEDRFNIMFDEYFEESLVQLEEFKRAGLVQETLSRVCVQGWGRLLLRNIAMCFDAYLKKLQETKPMFSRTV